MDSDISFFVHLSERYRDLIGAADCIVRMKETALSVQGNISKMRNSCDIHALKRSVATKTKKEQTGAVGTKKRISRHWKKITSPTRSTEGDVSSFEKAGGSNDRR